MKFQSKFIHFHSRKCIWKCRLRNGSHVVLASMWYCNDFIILISISNTISHHGRKIIVLNLFPWKKNGICIQISFKFVPMVPVAASQNWSWCQAGDIDKPFPEQVMMQFTDMYMHHDALTHWSLVMHLCISKLGHYWFKAMTSVFTKIIGHIGHFRWHGPNVRWEISQIWIEYIKSIGQMSDEPWKFFGYSVTWYLIGTKPLQYLNQLLYPRPTKLEGGYTGFTLSVRLSVCL